MNETLEMALVELISKATTGVEKSVDFLSSELPDVITQLILWKTAHYGFYACFAIIMAVVSVFFSVKVFKTKAPVSKEDHTGFKLLLWDCYGDSYRRDDFCVFICACLCTVLAGIGVLIFLSHAANLLQVVLAPKVYLIEYASNLVSK